MAEEASGTVTMSCPLCGLDLSGQVNEDLNLHLDICLNKAAVQEARGEARKQATAPPFGLPFSKEAGKRLGRPDTEKSKRPRQPPPQQGRVPIEAYFVTMPPKRLATSK